MLNVIMNEEVQSIIKISMQLCNVCKHICKYACMYTAR